MSFSITWGYDASVCVQLTKNGNAFTIDPGATVTGVLKSGTTPISPEVTASEAAAGADWSASLVVFAWTEAETAQIVANTYPAQVTLEVQVDDGGVKTGWFIDGILEHGAIA